MNPGSPEAVAKGCTCPRLDNANGQGSGYKNDQGEPLFWRSADCPWHGVTANDP